MSSSECSDDGQLEESNPYDELIAYVDDVKALRCQSIELPDTVSVIECENGSKVYLIGTAHFSQESINDVIKMGFNRGLLNFLLMRVSAQLIDQIGMAPGGEFRAAVMEAKRQPHVHVVLGDRAIDATLSRAMNSMGPWTKLQFLGILLKSLGPITKEEIEEMKKSDILEQLVSEMGAKHPELSQVIIDERDQYLARSIWETTLISPACASNPSDVCSDEETELTSCCPHWVKPSVLPRVIVAVVGIGHVAGIKKYWPVAHTINKHDLSAVIQPSTSWKLFKWGLAGLFLSAFVGAGYGIIRTLVRVVFWFTR